MEESFKQAPIYVLNAVQQNLRICNAGGERDCEFLGLCQANSSSWWVGFKTRKSKLVAVIILKVWTVCVTKVFCIIRSDKMVTISSGAQGPQSLICRTLGWIPTKREKGGIKWLLSFFILPTRTKSVTKEFLDSRFLIIKRRNKSHTEKVVLRLS